MSWQASAYIKKLRAAPNGERITAYEKLILLHLADAHNEDRGICWPSQPTIADDCMVSVRHVQNLLHALEKKGVIRVIRPERNGRGRYLSYSFPELDVEAGKDARRAPFSFQPRKRTERRIGGTENLNDTRKKDESDGSPDKEEKGTQNEDEPEHHASRCYAMTTAHKQALSAWVAVKERLRKELNFDEWNLWVRPAMLCKLLSGGHLLIALPPNSRIISAASERLTLLRSLLKNHGYGVSFTRYPDEGDRQRLKAEFPEFYRGMIGNIERARKA